MYARWIYSLIIALMVGLVIATGIAQAQQLSWNVPSPDVMDKGQFGISHSQYVRPWRTSSGTSAIAVFQGIYGLGYDIEIGLNIAGVDERRISDSPLFMEATLKWRPWQTNINGSTVGFFLGNTIGIGVNGPVSSHIRNFLYGSAFLQMPFGMRVSAGPYYATHDVFDTHARAGAQVSLEQSLPFTLPFVFVTDWQSGPGGITTTGLFYTEKNINIGIGYGLSNNGRANDLLQFVAAFKF